MFLGAFAMGSPWPGSSVGVTFLHSIGTKASYNGLRCFPSGWGHPLGQVCFTFTLDLDRWIPFRYWFLFLPAGVPRPVLLLAPDFPWLAFVGFFCAPPLFSVGFLLLASFLASPYWVFSHRLFLGPYFVLLLATSSVPLLLLCSTLQFWVVFWSLGGLLFFCPCSLLFRVRQFLFSCLEFRLLVFRVSCWSHWGFFLSYPVAFLSSSRFLLLCRGSLCVPCADLLAIVFVTLYFLFSVVFLFFYTGFRFSCSSSLLSLFGCSFSSPPSSSSSVP